jgi:hypothetical protein
MVSRARRERRFAVNLASPHPVHPSELLTSRASTGGVFPRATPFASVPEFAPGSVRLDPELVGQHPGHPGGYADRVVEIRLGAGEGGLFLQMSPDVIMASVARGADAGGTRC